MNVMIKPINDFDSSEIAELEKKYNYGTTRAGFDLTQSLDQKVSDSFDQAIINEIVLWKVNRFVSVYHCDWLSDFNLLKSISELAGNEAYVRSILKRMLNTHGIRLPMASTMLRFRNPQVFQIIDVRTFSVIFGDDEMLLKKYSSSNVDLHIEIYFEYLGELKSICSKKDIPFSKSDRILYQFDIERRKQSQ